MPHAARSVIPLALLAAPSSPAVTKRSRRRRGRRLPPGWRRSTPRWRRRSRASGQKTQEGWRVGYIVEAAEPSFVSHHGSQHLRAPRAGETHHIEILPFEESSGRLVPHTPVDLEIVDADGTVVEGRELQFLYGEFFRYPTNVSIPEPGTYTLRARIGVPTDVRAARRGR